MGKIYYFNEMDEYFDSEWKLTIDISDIWQTHQSDNTNMLDFNKKYIDRIVKYKKNINDLGNDVWEGILPMLNEIKEETDEKKIISVYDKIYDWADGNDILIKSK